MDFHFIILICVNYSCDFGAKGLAMIRLSSVDYISFSGKCNQVNGGFIVLRLREV